MGSLKCKSTTKLSMCQFACRDKLPRSKERRKQLSYHNDKVVEMLVVMQRKVRNIPRTDKTIETQQ